MARATVWLNAGGVVDAEIGIRKGDAALDVLSILSDGTFTFFAEVTGREGTVIAADVIERNWQAKAPRVTALLAELPSLIEALAWEPTSLDDVGSEHPAHRQLLAALRSGGTLLEALIDVDVELVAALELFQKALRKQNEARRQASQEKRAVFGSETLLQVAPLASEARSGAAGAVVGVRPPRTVLNADKRSLALSASQTPQRASDPAKPENPLARTLVGMPAAELLASAGIKDLADVNAGIIEMTAEPSGEPKAVRARRFSRPPDDRAPETLDALEVGDVLELVPETVRRYTPQDVHEEPERTSDGESDAPVPSSIEGSTMVLGGRRLARVSVLSDGARFAVQLVADAARSDGSEMALKMPRREEQTTFAALQTEAAVLGAVSHPNLVRLSQAGLDGNWPYLLTWYWPGVTLDSLIAPNKPLPTGLVVCIVRQVLEAANALHDPTNPRGGFVHCNLCPENVLVGLDGVVRVCGLSNARRVKSKVNDEDLAVHAQYAAPELLRGQRVDERSDVFSAGALLELALRGEGTQESASLAQVRAIWSRATDPLPAQRYANAGDFLLAIERLPDVWKPGQVADWLAKDLTQLKLEAARSLSPARDLGPTWRRKLAIGLGILVVVVVAIVLAWMSKK